MATTMTAMTLERFEALKAERIAEHGAFGWFFGCRKHGAHLDPRCTNCRFVAHHNAKICNELALAMGWLVDEPAGDVPMTR